MPTIQSGSTLERYFDNDTTITITPASGGSVRFGCSSPVGATRPADRVIYSATSIDVPGGSTVFAQAVGGDALLIDANGLGGNVAPYLGVVANRLSVPNQFNASFKQLMARSKHYATDNITSLALVFVNAWVRRSGGTVGEVNAGSSATFTAAIEYPSGTIAAVITFGGATSGTVADGGTLQSDLVPVNIPIGAPFFVRTWMSCAAGIPHHLGGGLNTSTGLNNAGESMVFSATTTPDITQTAGNFANQSANYFYRPAAIVSMTTKPSFMLCGDSRLGNGVNNDVISDGYGLTGEIDKALGMTYGTINAGCGGERVQNVASTGYAVRGSLIKYVSHGVVSYGINDICNFDAAGARSAAQVQADITTFIGRFGGKPVYVATLSPVSTSTDSWATTVNQTTHANNAVRVAHNAWVRSITPPVAGYFEVADATESARDSGIWKAPGYTADGIHGNATATTAVKMYGGVAIPAVNH